MTLVSFSTSSNSVLERSWSHRNLFTFSLILYSVLMEGVDCEVGNETLKDLNEGGCILTDERDRDNQLPYVGRLAPTPSGYMHGKY